VVAVDGRKLTASVSSDSNVDYDRIAREIIAEAIASDEAVDEQHGDARRPGRTVAAPPPNNSSSDYQ
jgi:hypothetical protein